MTDAAYRLVPLTLFALIASALPHIFRVPLQISIIVAGILFARLVIHKKVRKMPPLWIKLILVIASFAVVLGTFHTINGVDAGSALLLCMVAIKTLEMNTLRDHTTLIMATFFIIVSFVLYDTAIWSALYLLFTSSISVFALLRISAPSLTNKRLIPNAKLFFMYGIPLAVVLFILFPRIPGPLWGIPNSSNQAKSGLSDSMTPGSISDLVKSTELAFRVKFTDKEPARRDLYWRGPVLHKFDGKTWNAANTRILRSSDANITLQDPAILHYDLILEPHNKKWLYVLDYPNHLPEQSVLFGDFHIERQNPITQLSRYTASAKITSATGSKNPVYIQSLATQLPEDGFRQTRALAKKLRRDYTTDQEIVDAALRMFNKEIFSYTLSPKLLDMSDPIDDFLFRTKEGFCEHYASAFVVLMRSAGIPARVVTGYLGGEKNQLSGYYRVTQADAHAWSEIYLEGQGWIRVDPTGAIAPERIEQSLEDTFPDSGLSGMFSNINLYLRMESAWYALNTKWFEFVLDFNAEKQMNLLKKLGFKKPDWRALIWLLVSGVLGLTLFMTYQISRQSRNIIKDPLLKIYLLFKIRLEKLGVPLVKGEGPREFCQRASELLPQHKEIIQNFTETYVENRYFETVSRTDKQKNLKVILKQL